jgi:hypothetical protein
VLGRPIDVGKPKRGVVCGVGDCHRDAKGSNGDVRSLNNILIPTN